MPIPIIGGAIAAGAELFKAAKESSAAKTASKQQQAAATKAQTINEQVYKDQQAAMAPYQALGTAAIGRYNDYVAQPFSQRLANVGQPYSPMTAAGGPMGPSQPMPNPGSLGGAPSPFAMGPGGAGGGMVQVQAPTGEVQMLPMAIAQRAVAAGGKILQQPGGGATDRAFRMGPQAA